MEAVQQLAKPLKKSQIDAASIFWSSGDWESKEFAQLRRAFPNPDDAVSIKAIVVNALYGTNIFAITKVAESVERVLKRTCSTGSDLVEELVSEIRVITKRSNYSFAAKYAHFFIDSSLPILDWYAEWMVSEHLGQMQSKNPKRYHKFTEDIETLKRVAGLSCSCDDLDSYLWVAGEYWYWKEHPKMQVNSYLKLQFENVLKDPVSEPVLAALLGLSEGDSAPIPKRTSITEYTSGELQALLHWVNSDGKLRTNDELADEMFEALPFSRRGSKIDAALKRAIGRG